MRAMSVKNQQGAVLILTLILLIILTLLGVTAMRTASFEERMAYNSQDSNLAFQSAESAIREAERRIDAEASLPHELPCPDDLASCGTIVYFISSETRFDSVADFENMDLSDWQTAGQTATSAVVGAAESAEYIIREVRFVPDSLNVGHGVPPGRYLYEITAIGVGETARAEKVLQSTFLRRY